MPFKDPARYAEAQQRSRSRQIAAHRCIRCGQPNDRPDINKRLGTACGCRAKDSAEKAAYRAEQQAKINAAFALMAAFQKKRR